LDAPDFGIAPIVLILARHLPSLHISARQEFARSGQSIEGIGQHLAFGIGGQKTGTSSHGWRWRYSAASTD